MVASPLNKARRGYAELSLDELADAMAESPTGNPLYYAAKAELARREAMWQQDASKAMQASANYMLWSVIAIALTTGLVALFTFLLWYSPQ